MEQAWVHWYFPAGKEMGQLYQPLQKEAYYPIAILYQPSK